MQHIQSKPSLKCLYLFLYILAPDCNVYKESSNSNGVYSVYPFSDQTIVKQVYCDLNTDEYGWIVSCFDDIVFYLSFV